MDFLVVVGQLDSSTDFFRFRRHALRLVERLRKKAQSLSRMAAKNGVTVNSLKLILRNTDLWVGHKELQAEYDLVDGIVRFDLWTSDGSKRDLIALACVSQEPSAPSPTVR